MHHTQKLTAVFFLCLASLCLHPGAAKCQVTKGQSELSIGIGAQSDYELITRYTAGDNNNYTHSPAFTLSYRYYLSRTFSLGLDLAYQQFVNYNANFYDNAGMHNVGSYTFIAPEITVSYLNKTIGAKKNELRLYGLASAGIAINEGGSNNGSRTVLPALQLSPVGVRFGRAVAGYVEAGLGNKGLVNGGISYRFPKRK